jgi:hypothetical protein
MNLLRMISQSNSTKLTLLHIRWELFPLGKMIKIIIKASFLDRKLKITGILKMQDMYSKLVHSLVKIELNLDI